MRLLLVNCINPNSFVQMMYPPLNLGYLASALRHYDKNIEIKIISKDFERTLEEFKPNVVGLSSVTQNYNIAKYYAMIAKEKGVLVLIGGTHISLMPQTMTKNMDIAIIGEGEQTIVELFKNDFKHFEEIKGISYWYTGMLATTEPRELIKDLDTIPYPARDLLKIDKRTIMFTSRGCPYKCVFCSSSNFWNDIRFHSAEYVVNEIRLLIDDYKVNFIDIADDLFIADKKRLQNIVKLIKEEKIDVWFGCDARANLLDDETMKLLKAMNVQKIVLGLESGNDRILTYLKGINGKPTVTVKQNYESVKLANKYNILVNTGFVIGSPDETKDEILDTLRLAHTNLNHFEPYILTPLPGTKVWEYAKSRGLVSDDMDFDKLNTFDVKDSIILSETLSKEEIFELYKKFKEYQKTLRIKSAIRHPLKNNIPQIAINMIKGMKL